MLTILSIDPSPTFSRSYEFVCPTCDVDEVFYHAPPENCLVCKQEYEFNAISLLQDQKYRARFCRGELNDNDKPSNRWRAARMY